MKAETVQLENGYTRISHPVLEALYMASFGAAQFRVLLYVIRQTWGWNRTEISFSYGDLATTLGLARSSAGDATKTLVAEGVLVQVQAPDFNNPGVYKLQKDPRKWGKFKVCPPGLEGVRQPGQSGTPDSTGNPDSPADRAGVSGTPDSECPADRTVRTRKPSSHAGSERPKESSKRQLKKELPTTPRARAPEADLDRLRSHLGAAGSAVDRMEAAAQQPPGWAASVYALYGPTPSDELAFRGLSPPDQVKVLGKTLERFAGESQPYHGSFFRSILMKVKDEHVNSSNGNGAGHRAGRGARRAAGAAGSSEAGGNRGQVWADDG